MLISDFKHGLFKYEVKDYYAILGVPVFADPKQMRLRYLKLAYQLHPDTNRDATKEEKNQASDILSKVVNPAYENLYKDKLRKECELILAEIANRLAPEADKVTVSSDIAKQLLQEEDLTKIKTIYQETLDKIVKDQYKDLHKIRLKVGLLSELNMIYVIREKQQELAQVTGGKYNKSSKTKTQPVASTISSSEGSINQPTVFRESTQAESPTIEQNKATTNEENLSPNLSTDEGTEKLTRVEKLLISAQRHLDTANFDPAIFDLREAVKLEPNNGVAHALLGLVYLEQSNRPYARIHIKKAVDLDKDNPQVKEAKAKLDTMEKKINKSNSTKTGKKAGKKTSKKDEGKKEAPKIFGIRLW